MKLFYIANIRFPTERAHGIQVASMCSAFAKQGMVVTLLVPDRKTFANDPFAYYGIEQNFTIEKVRVPDVVGFGGMGFLIESLLFASRAARRVQKEKGAVVYTREELPLFFLPRENTFYEAHQLRKSVFFRVLLRRAKGIVSISQGLKDALVGTGLPEEKIFVAHDGYDEKQFAERVPKSEARIRLGLPHDKKIALYVGGLEAWKGAETLCKAAKSLAENDILTVILGGTDAEVKKLQLQYPDIRFLGARPYRELPVNQQAADVLVVPNSGTSELGSRFTSPLKLFAHMASGVALVVADTPSLREVVRPTQLLKFVPDNPESLADAIKRALSSEWLANWVSKEAAKVKKRAEEFTWDKRAKHVLAYMRQVCTNESL